LLISTGFIPLSLGVNVNVSTNTYFYKNEFGIKTWKRVFGGDNIDSGNNVIQSSDGCYIIAGVTNSFDIKYGDGWLLKIDENGIEIWNRTFGDESWEYLSSVYQTNDNGYILSGNKNDSCWLIRTDADGNELWNKTYIGHGAAHGSTIIETMEGDYFVCGSTRSGEYVNDGSIFLLRVNKFGEEIWNKTLGNNQENGASSCKQTLDGGFIISGAIYNETFERVDAFLLKINSYGSEEWISKFYSDVADYMAAADVIQNSDGSYVIVGIFDKETYGWFKGFMLKTDSNGNELWRREYSNFLTFKTVYSVCHTNDGGYILSGEICNLIKFDYDLWLAKTDKNGNLEWSRKYGKQGEQYQWTIDVNGQALQTQDGGYLVLGHSNSYGVDSGDWDILLIKTDSKGFLPRPKTLPNQFFTKFMYTFPLIQRILNYIH
jgi:hypothetical protein